MAYQSGDDPRLVDDLRAALKRWHRPTLGEAALAGGLVDVTRRLAANRRLTRSKALRQTIRAALAALRVRERAAQAELLERRYLRRESITRLATAYHLSERSIHTRLHEARIALAHALWALEDTERKAAPDAVGAAGSLPALARARHLPPQRCTHLFGFHEELARLLAYLDDQDGHWVISLDGMAGAGKTALAREAARRMAETERFADIAWATIRPPAMAWSGKWTSDQPALTCGQVLDTIADQLAGVDLAPLRLAQKRDRVRELLAGGAYLVVLDNLEAVIDCGALPDWLWKMADPTKFLLTSRHWLEAEVGRSVLSLDPLGEADSLALIHHEAQLRGLREVDAAGDEALGRILAVTGGNPLAIELVVGQLVSRPLDHVLTALETARADVSAFYEYLYCASWDLLSPAAQQLLLRMIELPVRGGTWEDLLAVSGLTGNALAGAIEELIAHSLLQATGFEEKTYSIHVLTHHFAARQAALQSQNGRTPA